MGMKYFLFIRHGKTLSNAERRYGQELGEPLCAEGVREAEALATSAALPPVTALISSPALRCRQTVEILYPGVGYTLCPMTEIDHGIFKGKTADDLAGDEDYEKWLKTGCMGDIPGGDSVVAFKEQCCAIFEHIAETSDAGTIAMVIHGGNIMAILERFASPKKELFAYHLENCGFFLCRYDSGALIVKRRGGAA